jgi:hypothetical protein
MDRANYPIYPDTAIFAASNSSMLIRNAAPIFVTGGSRVNLIVGTKAVFSPPLDRPLYVAIRLPLAQGATAGGFSLASAEGCRGVVVGGDYSKPNEPSYTAAYSTDGHFLQWRAAQTPPHGYRSSVAYDTKTKTWITVGPNGTDISRDDGKNWTALKPGPQDAPDADKNWNALSLPFVVGPKRPHRKTPPRSPQTLTNIRAILFQSVILSEAAQPRSRRICGRFCGRCL